MSCMRYGGSLALMGFFGFGSDCPCLLFFFREFLLFRNGGEYGQSSKFGNDPMGGSRSRRAKRLRSQPVKSQRSDQGDWEDVSAHRLSGHALTQSPWLAFRASCQCDLLAALVSTAPTHAALSTTHVLMRLRALCIKPNGAHRLALIWRQHGVDGSPAQWPLQPRALSSPMA